MSQSQELQPQRAEMKEHLPLFSPWLVGWLVGWLDLFKVVQQTGISASLYEDDFWQ